MSVLEPSLRVPTSHVSVCHISATLTKIVEMAMMNGIVVSYFIDILCTYDSVPIPTNLLSQRSFCLNHLQYGLTRKVGNNSLKEQAKRL